ncbi:MAG: LysR family hydrogen peroxide-inducible transcriptional activator [Pseudohongiellaceae bacterium]|jgi:LysR family hydrogen peroxide-inducible transcriptional activator
MTEKAHQFTLRQLQYVIAIAEQLSFRKAAEHCHVSQPSLSAQVAQVERALGVTLFERDRRRVLVTSEGAEIIDRARTVLRAADDLADQADRAADPFARTLRIGVIPTVSPYLLPALTPALAAAYPALTVRWVEDQTAVLLRDLENGELETALLALEADIGDVERAIIASDPFVLVTAATTPLGKRRNLATPKDLHQAEVLLLDDGHCFRDQALAICSRSQAHELDFRATSLSTLVQMVASGSGVTLLPQLAVPLETSRTDLRVRRFRDPAPHRTIALVWRARSPLGQALRQLAGTITAAYPT